ncbi:hypothetical protein JCM4914_42270 [Streptomyces platensis subsp. malvinus]
MLQGLGEVCCQGVPYGIGGGSALQPGRYGRGQAAYVPLGEQQPGFVAVQLREEGGGGAVTLQVGGAGLGERFRRFGAGRGHGVGSRGLYGTGRGLLGGRRQLPGLLGRVDRLGRRGDGRAWLVVGHRAGDDLAAGQPFPGARQVAVGLQLPQGPGDAVLALGEAGRQELDADPGAHGQRLDVDGEPDREEGEFAVLGEVVSDDRVAGGVADFDVNDTGSGGRAGNGRRGARGRARVLQSHREALTSWVVRPSIGIRRPGRGPSHVWSCRGEHMPMNRPQIQPSWAMSPG